MSSRPRRKKTAIKTDHGDEPEVPEASEQKESEAKPAPAKDAGSKGQPSPPPPESPQFTIGTVAIIYYLAVIVMVGVPVWYRTTTPVRHSLPDISNLMVHSQMLTHRIAVTVIAVDDRIDDDRRTELRQQLTAGWSRGVSSDGAYAFEYKWKVRPAIDEELSIFKNSKNLQEVDMSLSDLASNQVEKKIWIFLVDDRMLGSESVAFGTSRFVYIKASDEALAETVIDTLGQILEPSRPVDSSMMSPPTAAQHESKKLLLDPELDIFINIIVEDANDADHIRKEIVPDIHMLAERALLKQSGIQELLKVKVTSQMVYYAIDPALLNRVHSNVRHLNAADIPLLLNNIETRIAEPNSKQGYNLNLIIPSRSQEGIVVFNDITTGKVSSTMVSSHNVAIIILNEKTDFNIAFKSLVRSLLTLPISMPKNSVRQNVFFAKWELDAVMRSISQNQVLKTLASLESIEKLLGKVGNIVIEKEISEKMHAAVQDSHAAIDNLATGYLSEAYALSTKAYINSEQAFFDPSLLELLYFPDDQKYAVYFPLFLPVGLPLATSFYHLFKLFKARALRK